MLRVYGEHPGEVHGGGEKFHHAAVSRLHAEVKGRHQPGHQPLGKGRQEVENEVEGGEGKGIAGDKHHQRGGGKVEKRIPQNAQDGHQQSHRLEDPRRQGDQDGQGPGDGVGNQHHGKAREKAGGEEALPGDGQGVVHAHAPGVVQPAPHRQGAEGAVHQGDGGHRVDQGVIVEGGGLQPAVEEGPPLMDEEGQQIQGEQGPDEGRAAPQGPEPGEVLFKERGIKERCL